MLLNDENDTERKKNFDNTFLIENKLMLNSHLYEPFPELPKRRSSYLRPMEKINETTLKLKLSIRRPNNFLTRKVKLLHVITG